MNLEEFRNYATEFNVIPVSRRLLADGNTPVGIYQKLAKNKENTFLLESAEHDGTWARYSFIGVRSEATLSEKNGVAYWQGVAPAGAPQGIDPLEALKICASHLRSPQISGLPPLTSGLVGFMGYDVVRRLEKIPNLTSKDIDLPELSFMLTSDLAVFDHSNATITLIANAINWDGSDDRVDQAYASCQSRLDQMESDLKAPLSSQAQRLPEFTSPEYEVNVTAEEFKSSVVKIKEEILSGEAFQVVLSQRFSMPSTADAIDVYRMLRLNNPSPYMYLFRFNGGIEIVGSSPEALVKVNQKDVMIHPIAGTRRRSADPREDEALARELLADPKERAEHLMLVDLGRNDLGRVCAPGTVEVADFMQIERYSHVMHIVSTVTGKLKEDATPADALFSVFPAGTLSGAPKPRAMEIIEEQESTRRGIYGGIVGYIDFTGNLDTAIAIRTALLLDGTAYVQAGAGIVADSDPESENQECHNKAAAVLSAIHAANRLGDSQ
ncbi:MAG: anthranilate synthase component I [Actinobacteria bacterium]|uniref:anthranilate synthase n=1 Tax=freshwater metagenome TaxID=449393 RepID=A0A6J6DKX4_9ZZZZ|nr:anthranilate synthase component I [Actinomycetota bacterium]